MFRKFWVEFRPRGNLAHDETESRSHRARIQTGGGDLTYKLKNYLRIIISCGSFIACIVTRLPFVKLMTIGFCEKAHPDRNEIGGLRTKSVSNAIWSIGQFFGFAIIPIIKAFLK
jgi:hypothetical protein